MNARRHEEDSLRTVKMILGIAGVACLVLACTAPVWAGTNQPAGNQAGAAPVTGPAQPAPKASPGAPAQAAPPLASTERPKGQHEGITVHGHWTIEVKNPDGTVASHREFENAIANGGADLLTGFMSGEYASGGFYVVLSTTPGNSGQLCAPYASEQPAPGFCGLIDTRTIIAACSAFAVGTQTGGCATTLTYTPNAGTYSTYGAVGYTLMGSIQPANGGTIATVETGAFTCTNGSLPATATTFSQVSPQTCGTTMLGAHFLSEDLTLTGVPAPGVTVITGQSVVVTVVITFGSS